MFADLHIHTDYSDGIYSPESIIKKSLKAKLTKISITDPVSYTHLTLPTKA